MHITVTVSRASRDRVKLETFKLQVPTAKYFLREIEYYSFNVRSVSPANWPTCDVTFITFGQNFAK